MSLRARVVSRTSLTQAERERMLALMQLCYDGVIAERFFADLDAKQAVMVMDDSSGTVMGFSTVRLTDEQLDGRRVKIVFSGDTVIHPDHWGTKALQSGFVSFVMREKLREPRVPLYWLLLSKGYRTYLLLANNFPVAFPRHDVTPRAALVALRDKVAAGWWGAQYDASTEVLRFTDARDRVKAGVAPIDTALLENPDIAFFVHKNPGHADGDELVCLAEIDFGLPLRFAFKQLVRALPLPARQARART